MKMYDELGYHNQLHDEDRYEVPKGKKEYIIKTLNPSKNLKPLDNRLKYAGTIFTRPKDYYNRNRKIDGVIVTNNSIIYKIAREKGYKEGKEIFLYDENGKC